MIYKINGGSTIQFVLPPFNIKRGLLNVGFEVSAFLKRSCNLSSFVQQHFFYFL